MKNKTLWALAALLVCAAAFVTRAAQDTVLSDGYAEVRDPVRLKLWLETNATDAETRIAVLEGTQAGGTLLPAYVLVGNATSNATGVAVSGDVTISTAGAVAIVANTIVDADIKSDAAIVSTKFASAVQTSLGKADTALQPNAVTVTNTIIGIGDITNVIVVVGGQLASWTITTP